MNISFSKNFLKRAKKLDPGTRAKLTASIQLFVNNPLNPKLRNHPLKGKYKSYRSIDVTSDIRALYIQEEDQAIFDTVGTHSQLYG